MRGDYSKGHKDGVESAKHERTANVVERLSDAISNPRYNDKGSKEYKEGFKDGRKDEQDKKK